MNKYASYILLLILCGCSSLNRYAYVPSEDEKIADEIIKKAAIELMVHTGLKPCGSGGQMMDKVKMLALSFDYKEPIQIDEARLLLIKAVDVLVATVNSDDRIRPYLHNYPFEPKNVEIRIFLRGRESFDVPPGELSVISSIGGTFHYEIDNPNAKFLITVLNETYEEAKQKLNASQFQEPYEPIPDSLTRCL